MYAGIETNPGTIEKFTSAGVGAIFSNTGLSQPLGLAFDKAGNLYAANYGNGTIEKFTSSGVASVFIGSGLVNPAGIAFDSSGDLYVADEGNNRIEKFSQSGVESVFANTGLNDPRGIALNSAGDLFVANIGDNTIEEFNPAGVGSVFASGGNLNDPEYLAFTNDSGQPPSLSSTAAVPEPSTWASFAISVAGALVLLRGRRRAI